jgi:signal transduction histidine kinase
VILNNLLSNAVKYLDPEKEKPTVWITINVDVEKAEVTIRDNGIGIEKKHQEKVFEMFYRGTSLAHGSGLGLYIARESADKLNGNIHMESEPGKGTEFYLVLPNLKIS